MYHINSVITSCQKLYRQWVASGSFCAGGLFMEGYICQHPEDHTADNK